MTARAAQASQAMHLHGVYNPHLLSFKRCSLLDSLLNHPSTVAANLPSTLVVKILNEKYEIATSNYFFCDIDIKNFYFQSRNIYSIIFTILMQRYDWKFREQIKSFEQDRRRYKGTILSFSVPNRSEQKQRSPPPSADMYALLGLYLTKFT